MAAPKQRNTNAEKADLRAGRIPEDWQDKPAKLSHKDRYARWALKVTRAEWQDDGPMPSSDLAIPFFGYKSHVSIDREYRFIRKWKTTDAAASSSARLREGLPDKANTASSVWADTAYRSKANEDFMDKQGFVSKVHRKKPHLKLMPRHIQRSNSGKSVIRSRQYRLQHAPLPLPRKIECEHIAIQQGTTLDLLKTQTENAPKNHQSTILRSLHFTHKTPSLLEQIIA